MPKKLMWFIVPLLMLLVVLLVPFLTDCRQGDNPVPPDAVHTGAGNSNTGNSDTGAGPGNGTVTSTDPSQAASFPAAGVSGETPGVPDATGGAAQPGPPAGGEVEPPGRSAAGEADTPGPPAASESNLPGLPAGGEAAAPGLEAAPPTGPVTPPAPGWPPATTPDPAGQPPATAPVQAASQAGETVPVQIAVIGKNGELLYGPGPVALPTGSPRGATALGALAATGLPYGVSSRFPDLVETVAGLRNQGQAGWLYQVNGTVPPVAAAKKKLAAHDRVIWWYSNSIHDPPPAWDSLARLP